VKAFPQDMIDHYGTRTSEGGMDLRDYFAARIMHFLLNADSDMDVWELAIEAYAVADAMMEARK